MAGVVVNGKLQDFHPGDTLIFRYVIQWNGALANLASDTLTFCLKRNFDDAELIHVTADVATDGANGVAIFTVTDEQTATLTPGNHVYDVHWARADGFEKTLQVEKVKVLRKVHEDPAP